MNEETDKNKIPQPVEEQEIDLIELAKKVWANRKLVFKTCGIAIIVALVVAFSIPKEYATSVTLAPETTGKSTGGSMGALAAMAGVNLGNSGGDDALFPELYPDIVSSTPFLTELFDVKVEDQKGELKTRLYDYLDEHQRGPWWGAVISAPLKALGWVVSLFKDEPTGQGDGKVNPFMLTKDEAARHDLKFTEKLYEEAKANYYTAQQKYARYADGNQNIVLHSVRTEQERLQNEMSLAYGVYNQVAQQLQMAKAKVQEITPVYTVVQPATVPLKPAKPNKIMILIGFVFLAGVGSVGWILFVKDLLKGWKQQTEK